MMKYNTSLNTAMTNLSRRTVLVAGAAFGTVTAAGLTSARARDPQPALPIPAELRASPSGELGFSAGTGVMRFLPGRTTTTCGYNGAFLGPALRLRRGQTVTINFANGLPEPTTVHWHGLIIPGDVDGGPSHLVGPGEHWRATLSIDQPAATLWFHPHAYPTTAAQVIKGLAGLLIIDDDDADQLKLPSRWGVDDIPLIIQDRRFRPDGQFFDRMNITAVTNGYVGDVPLVNGARYPQARTTCGWIRLRLLDASNARSYALKASDGRSLFVIGSDGRLLESPVEMKQIVMHAGERFEVMVDCRSGVPFDLIAVPTGEPIMRLPPFDGPVPLLTIRPDGAEAQGLLPTSLTKLPPIPTTLPAVSQELVMNMFRDKDGMVPLMKAGLGMDEGGKALSMKADMAQDRVSKIPTMKMGMGMGGGSKAPSMEMAMASKIDPAIVARVVRLIENQPEIPRAEQLAANGINGKPFALGKPAFAAPRAQELRWRLSQGDDRMPHPVHIHGCQFRIVSEHGRPPEAHRAGWKDTAPISAAGVSEILVSFPFPAGPEAPYMAHCHILEHEDSGMMAPFTVA